MYIVTAFHPGSDCGLGIVGKCIEPITSKGPTKDGFKYKMF